MHSFCGLHWEELTIVANTTGATVIFLQSHPVWTAARRQERERREAMRRHPAFRARQRAAAAGGEVIPLIRDDKLYSSTNTPA
ncbi:hypothetical protein [Mycobacterium sp. E2733]|uniref:hypothetical protein n=1 Tax=Mycobacterium sp. E2733 TaxID=1834138 RepID=UPI001E300953|nr:hypothetical protein [Mycobacterium sp. E2733]